MGLGATAAAVGHVCTLQLQQPDAPALLLSGFPGTGRLFSHCICFQQQTCYGTCQGSGCSSSSRCCCRPCVSHHPLCRPCWLCGSCCVCCCRLVLCLLSKQQGIGRGAVLHQWASHDHLLYFQLSFFPRVACIPGLASLVARVGPLSPGLLHRLWWEQALWG